MESTDSSTALRHPQLPPGFRFHPTDEELVVHYLKKRSAGLPLPAAIITEIDLYKFDPWELPAKAAFGETEWYFFSPRDRKYPNGARPNRAATSGYWKATGIDKPVWTAGGTQKVGVKKALVFYGGKPPKGIKTNWIMHEYRLTDHKANCKPPVYDPSKSKGSLRLDDWVLCRIYKKSYTQRPADSDSGGGGGGGGGGDDGGGDLTMNGILTSPLPYRSYNHNWFTKPTGTCTGYNAMVENNNEHNIFFDNLLTSENHHHNTIGSTSNLLPEKRSTLPGQFWHQEENKVSSSSSSSMATQLQLQQQTLLLAPGESMFPLPDMNWYS